MEKIVKIKVNGILLFISMDEPEYKNCFAIYKNLFFQFGLNSKLLTILNKNDFEELVIDIVNEAYERKTKQRH